MFCLPPHSSHCTQPLDKDCFGPLKKFWRQECHNFLIKNPGKVVTRFDFSQLFAQAWFKSMTMTNIIGGFKVTGIFPFNRDALLPSSPVPNSLCQRTGLKFIPLFSPASCRPIRESIKVLDTPQESSRGQSICYNGNIPFGKTLRFIHTIIIMMPH